MGKINFEIGHNKIYEDQVFLASNVPIIFSGIDSEHNTYICAMYHSDTEKRQWIISGCPAHRMTDMLSDRISVREAFLENGVLHVIITKRYDGKTIVSEYNDTEWNDRPELPETGEKMDADPGEFDEEIEYFNGLYWNGVFDTLISVADMVSKFTVDIPQMSHTVQEALVNMARQVTGQYDKSITYTSIDDTTEYMPLLEKKGTAYIAA